VVFKNYSKAPTSEHHLIEPGSVGNCSWHSLNCSKICNRQELKQNWRIWHRLKGVPATIPTSTSLIQNLNATWKAGTGY